MFSDDTTSFGSAAGDAAERARHHTLPFGHPSRTVSLAHGDGIGPEVMDAVLRIFRHAQVPLIFETVDMGERQLRAGVTGGLPQSAIDSVFKTGILFRGPCGLSRDTAAIVEATTLDAFSVYASKRFFRALPGLQARPGAGGTNITLVSECLSLSSAPSQSPARLIGRTHEYAFAMARRKGSRRVTCAFEATASDLNDQLFLSSFRSEAVNHPDLQADAQVVEELAMQLVADPTAFDVVVVPSNHIGLLYHVAAGLVGGLGQAPSAKIGQGVGIFEPVHGASLKQAGTGTANPTAQLLSGCMMLRQLGLWPWAQQLEEALQTTLAALSLRNDGHGAAAFDTHAFVDTMFRALDAGAPVRLERDATQKARHGLQQNTLGAAPGNLQQPQQPVDLAG